MWDITESSVTMMAACIPVLRILLREVRSSTRKGYTTYELNSTQLFERRSSNRVPDVSLSRDDLWAPSSPGGESFKEPHFHADKAVYASSRGEHFGDMDIVRYT